MKHLSFLLGAIVGAMAGTIGGSLPAVLGAGAPGLPVKDEGPRQPGSQGSLLPITLRQSIQPLQARFNQDVARTRLLLLVSPT